MSKPRGGQSFGIILGDARDCPSGIRHVGGAKLNQALVRNVRTYAAMRREKAQAAPTARPKVPMRRLGADCSVVAGKRGNARGAEGAGYRHLSRVNRQREEPDAQWKAAAFARWHEPDDARVFKSGSGAARLADVLAGESPANRGV